MNNIPKNLPESVLNQLHSRDEKIIAILGHGAISSIIAGRGYSRGYMLLTDQRIYMRSKSGVINKTKIDAVARLEDITDSQVVSSSHG